MAENKKSVLLYCDIIHTVEGLTDKEAGKLFKHYLRYINDLEPVAPDKVTQLVFEPIKQALKRDLKKWECIVEKRSLAGHASAEKRKQNKQVLTSVESVEQTPTNPTVRVNDSDIVKEINKSNTPDLSKSNLFRQPKIPESEEVHRVFIQHGGTEEMAKAFFEKNNSVGWFLRGSPITNFVNLVPSFIKNWNEIKNKNATDKSNTGKVRTGKSASAYAALDSFNTDIKNLSG